MDPQQQRKQELPRQTLFRELRFDRAGIDEESRSVPVSFSSETDTVLRWGEPEILDHSPGAADLTRLGSIGVVLFNHNPDWPIGRIENARIEGGRGLATLVFDEDAESDKVFRKVVSGTLKGISVSYTCEDYQFLGVGENSSDGRFKGPCLWVKRWTALEISVVSVPADTTVGIGRSALPDLGPVVAAILDGVAERLRSASSLPAEPALQAEWAAETVPEASPASSPEPLPEVFGSGELEADLFWLESFVAPEILS